MKKVLAFLLPTLLILATFVTKRGTYLEAVADEPTVLEVSLFDTMPSRAVQAFGIEDVRGVKIELPNGAYASYFRYEANPSDVLQAIASLPFPLYAERADTLCLPLTSREIELLKNLASEREKKEASFFWSADLSEYDLFESLKPPFRHTLMINKKTNQILHRIELVG
jgi:hypothetical protein